MLLAPCSTHSYPSFFEQESVQISMWKRLLLLYLYICYSLLVSTWASLVAQMVKNPPVIQEPWVRSLGWEDPLEEGVATHSGILAWRIPTDRGIWQATVHGITKSQTRLSDLAHMWYPRSPARDGTHVPCFGRPMDS